jgi:zinc protease
MNKLTLAVISTALIAACGGGAPEAQAPGGARAVVPVAVSPQPTTTPDAPFRKGPPPPDGTVTFQAPAVSEATLKNGLRVLVVERHDLPIVGVRLIISAGAGDVPEARPGSLSFLGGLLEQGTKKRTALEIDDAYEAIGAHHGAWFDWDSGGTSVKVLADKLDEALEIMSDVAQNPTFPQAEVERFRARRIASIQAEKNSPGTAAQNVLAAALFGRSHPYGNSLSGQEADAKKVTRAELVRLYQRLFHPKNAAIVVAGDVTKDAILAKLETAFGGWKNRPGAVVRKPPTLPKNPATDKRVVLVDRPGAQSQIQLVRTGVPFGSKERDAIVVTNAILGGMFSSRVNMNLRERNAFTYGARSHFLMRHGAGPFQVGAAVFSDKTIPAIKEVVSELEGLRRDGPTPEELALAKESILMAMPGRFESVADVTGAIADLVTYDLPLDHYATRPARIEAVTAADVTRLAGELMAPEDMTLVVVGDKAKLAPQVDELGFGPFEERDAYGNLVPKASPSKN